MNDHRHIRIIENEITVLPSSPVQHENRIYAENETRVTVHPDLTLEIHGEKFSVTRKLSVSDGLALITVLGFSLQDAVYIDPEVK